MEQRRALISVSDKTGLQEFSKQLSLLGVEIVASGSTAKAIQSGGVDVKLVESVTGFPEVLEGRVKTLHPAIHCGILSKGRPQDDDELSKHGIRKFDFVICNLYPFESAVRKQCSVQEAIENIDIGGVALLRAAAKNYSRLTVVSEPNDYDEIIRSLNGSREVPLELRQVLALKAFQKVSQYDEFISLYFRNSIVHHDASQYFIPLRYGTNPHQSSACVFAKSGKLPFQVLCGKPGYINILDALNSWPLVKELSQATGLPAAVSFKHVSPSGAAVGTPLSKSEIQALAVRNSDGLTPIASAYARARGSDRMSSFGDWIALSCECDEATAKIISSEVSDGIIAPSYSLKALEILRAKKAGAYCVLKMDPEYSPEDGHVETREVYGVTLEQQRNNLQVTRNMFSNLVTNNVAKVTESHLRDLLVATITLKYTQSNSVCYAKNGQVTGIGAGQQSRIHCTRLAGEKSDNFFLRQHPKTLSLKFKPGTKRPVQANAIDAYVTGNIGNAEEFCEMFEGTPELLTEEEKRDWISKQSDVVVASDGFFPFSDNIVRAKESGVSVIAAPRGSVMDTSVINEANRLNVALIFMDYRFFHH